MILEINYFHIQIIAIINKTSEIFATILTEGLLFFVIQDCQLKPSMLIKQLLSW